MMWLFHPREATVWLKYIPAILLFCSFPILSLLKKNKKFRVLGKRVGFILSPTFFGPQTVEDFGCSLIDSTRAKILLDARQ